MSKVGLIHILDLPSLLAVCLVVRIPLIVQKTASFTRRMQSNFDSWWRKAKSDIDYRTNFQPPPSIVTITRDR
jgi:hypothetical protein